MKAEINRDLLVSLESTTAKCFADLEAKKKKRKWTGKYAWKRKFREGKRS